MIRDLIKSEDPLLHKRIDSCSYNLDRQFLSRTLIDSMIHHNGIGLSANQVGLNAAVFTMGTGKDGKQWYIINPDVITVSEECDTMEEGCLSAPGLMLKVKRPTKISVSYQNTDGDPVLEEFDGIWARVFLHEYDHMLGQNFLQRVSIYMGQQVKTFLSSRQVKTHYPVKCHISLNFAHAASRE